MNKVILPDSPGYHAEIQTVGEGDNVSIRAINGKPIGKITSTKDIHNLPDEQMEALAGIARRMLIAAQEAEDQGGSDKL